MEGTCVPPPSVDPRHSLVFISAGHYEQPCLARAADRLTRFWLDHWKWIIGVAVTVGVAIVKLR